MTSNDPKVEMANHLKLVDALQVAFLKKDFIQVYELVPALIRRINSLQRQIELMTRSFDYNGEPFEPKEEG